LRAHLIAYKDGVAGVRVGCSARIGVEVAGGRRGQSGSESELGATGACLDFVNNNMVTAHHYLLRMGLIMDPYPIKADGDGQIDRLIVF